MPDANPQALQPPLQGEVPPTALYQPPLQGEVPPTGGGGVNRVSELGRCMCCQ